MKKALLGSLIFFAFAANAADPQPNPDTTSTVTFKGKVVANTCKISTDSQNLTVTLPTVGKNALSQAGQVAGPKPFQIKLTNCVAATSGNPQATSVSARFYKIPATSSTVYNSVAGAIDVDHNFTLKNTKNGGAQNVNIQIFEENGSTPVPVATTGFTGTAPTTSSYKTINGQGDITLHYVAKYYATGVATPGEVETATNFEIVYQ